MEGILLYIIQINVLLTLLFIGYYFLLRTLTFYRINRVYLLVGAIYACVYPFLDLSSWFAQTAPEIHAEFLIHMPNLSDAAPRLGFAELLAWFVGVGAGFCLLLFIVRLLSLWRIHRYSSSALWCSYHYRNVWFPVRPFSFFNRVYLHRQQHAEGELLDIFKHEYVHVRGLHSLDTLVFELIVIVCWYNPFAWLLRKAVQQNLEFLTDQQVLKQGADRRGYQYALLQVAESRIGSEMGNSFNFDFLKRRIMMMNKKRSSSKQIGRYAFLIPTLLIGGITVTVNQANAKIEHVVDQIGERQFALPLLSTAEVIGKDKPTIDTLKGRESRVTLRPVAVGVKGEKTEESALPQQKPLMVVDGEERSNLDDVDPNSIQSISVLKDGKSVAAYGEKGKNGVVLITTKKNQQSGVNAASQGPLYVVDGQEEPADFQVESLDTSAVTSVHVIKGEKAVSAYGEKGKNGVVEITRKDQ